MNRENPTFWWMLLVLTLLTLGVALYKIIFKSEPAYIQLCIGAALSGAVLKDVPLFIRYKFLSIVPASAAVIFLVLSILNALKK